MARDTVSVSYTHLVDLPPPPNCHHFSRQISFGRFTVAVSSIPIHLVIRSAMILPSQARANYCQTRFAVVLARIWKILLTNAVNWQQSGFHSGLTKKRFLIPFSDKTFLGKRHHDLYIDYTEIINTHVMSIIMNNEYNNEYNSVCVFVCARSRIFMCICIYELYTH